MCPRPHRRSTRESVLPPFVGRSTGHYQRKGCFRVISWTNSVLVLKLFIPQLRQQLNHLVQVYFTQSLLLLQMRSNHSQNLHYCLAKLPFLLPPSEYQQYLPQPKLPLFYLVLLQSMNLPPPRPPQFCIHLTKPIQFQCTPRPPPRKHRGHLPARGVPSHCSLM